MADSDNSLARKRLTRSIAAAAGIFGSHIHPGWLIRLQVVYQFGCSHSPVGRWVPAYSTRTPNAPQGLGYNAERDEDAQSKLMPDPITVVTDRVEA